MSCVFSVLKNSIRVQKNVISGENSFEKKILEHFYRTKRFVFEFVFELIFELAHFRRYQHFRGFWQSTASSYRDCSHDGIDGEYPAVFPSHRARC